MPQQPLQSLRGEPQYLHQVVLEVAHPKPEQHVGNIVSAQQHAAKPHQPHPQQDQDPQRCSQHQVSQQEAATHGGSGGVAGGEGVAVHREGGKHVHLVMSRPPSTHHRFDYADQDEVQQKTCEDQDTHKGERYDLTYKDTNMTANTRHTQKSFLWHHLVAVRRKCQKAIPSFRNAFCFLYKTNLTSNACIVSSYWSSFYIRYIFNDPHKSLDQLLKTMWRY